MAISTEKLDDLYDDHEDDLVSYTDTATVSNTMESWERERTKIISSSPRIMRTRSPHSVEYRDYHIKKKIVTDSRHYFSDPICSEDTSKYDSYLTQIGRSITSQLLRLDGIVSVSSQYFDLSIKKGVAFRWRDLQPQIVSIIKCELHKEYTLNRIRTAK